MLWSFARENLEVALEREGFKVLGLGGCSIHINPRLPYTLDPKPHKAVLEDL